MKKQQISSDIKRRAFFFNYCFEKGLRFVDTYKSMTAMVFEKKQPETTVYHQHKAYTQWVNNNQNITNNETVVQNIHHLSVNNTPENILTTHTSFPKIPPSQSIFLKEERMQKITAVHHKLDLFTSRVHKRFHIFGQYQHQHQYQHSIGEDKRVSLSHMTQHRHVEMNENQHTEVQHLSLTNTIQTESIKVLEERLLNRIDAKMNVNTNEQKRNNMHEEHIVLQREEKKMVDKVYTLVMKRRDKELKRKGYLYG